MTWSPTLYVQFPDEPTARAMALQLGVDFPDDGTIPTGNHNYALQAPIAAPWMTPPAYDDDGETVTPGVRNTGYWAMLRLNNDYAGTPEILSELQAVGVLRELAEPPVVWAGVDE